ncbi:DUF742 domain-containing protein [Pseudonocardia sp.]|uniref:DUF742 domain-containing protein n=1 Tax=Pseudonocardia sp. TaxID=60912 RepID=UPI003D0A6860
MPEDARPEIGYTGARFGGGGRKRRAPATPVSPAAEPAPEERAEPESGGPVVGYTGARFGGSSRRRTRTRTAEPGPAPEPEPIATDPPVVEWPLYRPEQDADIDADADTALDGDIDPDTQTFTGGAAASPSSIRIRPYILTGGRTRAEIELELETLVSAGPRPPREHHAVVALCRRPVSVAEVAALMNAPIGVARVVLGDLAAQGAVTVHATGVQDIPDLAFLERVLTGLRRL